MDRNRFLQLAAQYANGTPTLVSVNGMKYHPISYTIKPEPGNKWLHTVRLCDAVQPNSFNDAPLEVVEEVQA